MRAPVECFEVKSDEIFGNIWHFVLWIVVVIVVVDVEADVDGWLCWCCHEAQFTLIVLQYYLAKCDTNECTKREDKSYDDGTWWNMLINRYRYLTPKYNPQIERERRPKNEQARKKDMYTKIHRNIFIEILLEHKSYSP